MNENGRDMSISSPSLSLIIAAISGCEWDIRYLGTYTYLITTY
jgi:hypothetical protein